MLKIPLSRPAETPNAGFVYQPRRFALTQSDPACTTRRLISELAGDWEQAAHDYEALERWEQAAECALHAGQQGRALSLYRRAGPEAYRKALQDGQWPDLQARLLTETLYADELCDLALELSNHGYGPAQDIHIDLESAVITANPISLASAAPGETISVSLKALAAQVGARQPFTLNLQYRDQNGLAFAGAPGFTIAVVRKSVTPVQHINYNAPVDQSVGKVHVEGDVGFIRAAEKTQPAGYSFCPYCRERLNLPKTPRFCPFCGETLG